LVSLRRSKRFYEATATGYVEGCVGPLAIVLSAFFGYSSPAEAAGPFFSFFLGFSSPSEESDEEPPSDEEDSSLFLFFLGYDLYSFAFD
jgi:hypothetical protein